MITLTERAIEEAKSLINTEAANGGQSLRLYLDGKGCDGFYYGVSFDSPSEEDHHFANEGIDVIVDPDSLDFVSGSKIDFVDDDRGRGFLVDNPNHKKFRGKFFKRKTWRERAGLPPKENA